MAINKRIRKDGSVGWQVVVDEYDPVTGRRKRHTIGTFDNNKVAKKEHAKAIVDMAKGRFVQRSGDTVADVMNMWITAHGPSVRATTLKQYQWAIDKRIVPTLGDMKIQKLTPALVQVAVNEWSGDRKSHTVAAAALNVLSAACKHAVGLQMIPANPCTHVIPPKPIKKQRTVWTESETARFLVSAADHPWSALWFLLVETGLRRGEALGLHWSDIDWDQSAIRISYTAVISPEEGEHHMVLMPTTKTDGSRRSLLVSDPLMDRLREWRKGRTDTVLVFEQNGAPLTASHVYHALQRLCVKASVPVVSIHELRHLAATRMMRAGVPIAVAQQRMGHTSSDMLRTVYQHADADAQREAVTALERLALSTALPEVTAISREERKG